MEKTRESTQLVIQPGIGIQHVCEIGWTEQRIRKTIESVHVYHIEGEDWSSERSVILTELGIICHVPSGKKDDLIEKITVHLSNSATHGVRLEAFHGRIGQGLMSAEPPIRTASVLEHFGVITNQADNVQAILPYAQVALPYRWVTPWGVEQLAYPNLGITFNLRSNTVESVEVYAAKTR